MKTQVFVFLSFAFFLLVPTAQSNEGGTLARIIDYTMSEIENEERNRSVILYSKARFRGDYFELKRNWSASRHRKSWEDEIASIEVPRGISVWIYEDRNFRGRSLCISGDWSVRDNPWWRHRISSVRIIYGTGRKHSRKHHRNHVWERDGEGRRSQRGKGVKLYEHRNFSGRTWTIHKDWLGGHKDYFWDDRISAIDIPKGYKVILYKHPGFRGKVLSLKGPMSVKLEKGSWNDEVSSIEIIRKR